MNDYETTIGRIASGEVVAESEVGAIAFAANKGKSDVEKDTAIVRERFANRHNFDEMTRTAAAGLYGRLRNLRRHLQGPDGDDRLVQLGGRSHSAIRAEIESVEKLINNPICGYFGAENGR